MHTNACYIVHVVLIQKESLHQIYGSAFDCSVCYGLTIILCGEVHIM